jgi:hypothetical protein
VKFSFPGNSWRQGELLLPVNEEQRMADADTGAGSNAKKILVYTLKPPERIRRPVFIFTT